jgi:hypothetical protein
MITQGLAEFVQASCERDIVAVDKRALTAALGAEFNATFCHSQVMLSRSTDGGLGRNQ